MRGAVTHVDQQWMYRRMLNAEADRDRRATVKGRDIHFWEDFDWAIEAIAFRLAYPRSRYPQ